MQTNEIIEDVVIYIIIKHVKRRLIHLRLNEDVFYVK
jgi:hypothetical protein